VHNKIGVEPIEGSFSLIDAILMSWCKLIKISCEIQTILEKGFVTFVSYIEDLSYGGSRFYFIWFAIVKYSSSTPLKGQLNSNFTPFFLESVHFSKSE
jgi:hypothetical protein